ncbi:BnaC06g43170D [Brassica napus]|uniref:BnaC06g43170D protein n=1 Tax=Brassica napus TaxID=3708 RepID=A0A078J640_BRANA|nr:BnaC06g43170D [Brassica napus]
MPRRRITRTPTKKMGTMALRDTDLLLLQCSISLHPTPLETLAFLQLMTFSLSSAYEVYFILTRVRNDIYAQPS